MVLGLELGLEAVMSEQSLKLEPESTRAPRCMQVHVHTQQQ